VRPSRSLGGNKILEALDNGHSSIRNKRLIRRVILLMSETIGDDDVDVVLVVGLDRVRRVAEIVS